MAIHIRRRAFISALLGGAAVAWPLAASAQQPAKVHRIAYISAAIAVTEMTETSSFRPTRAFFQELRRLGYVEGRNLIVERYSGQGRAEHYAELARDVVRSKPDVIFAASGNVMVQHLKPLTATIPIVGSMGDPVGFGLVASLAHPGGNATGVSIDAGPEITTKFLELLREATPRVSRVGFLSPVLPRNTYRKLLEEGAQGLGLVLVGPPLEGTLQETEYRRVFEAMAQEHADALVVALTVWIFSLVRRDTSTGSSKANRLATSLSIRQSSSSW